MRVLLITHIMSVCVCVCVCVCVGERKAHDGYYSYQSILKFPQQCVTVHRLSQIWPGSARLKSFQRFMHII